MNHSIKIIFTGDLAPVGAAASAGEKKYTLHISDEIKELFHSADLRIVNLETPLTLSETRIPKTGPHVKAHPDSISLLKDLQVDVACLSNNHIRDFGDQGVMDTIKVCRDNGIKTVGAGINLAGAAKPLILNVKSKKIAILNFSESEFNDAGETQAGSNPDDPIHIWRSVSTTKEISDILIVIVHGGKEMYPYPTPNQMNLYRFIADIGADLVVGHHSHVIGPYEVYHNVPIFYSLGNFIFDEKFNPPEWYVGALLKCNINFSSETLVNFELIPIHFSELDPKLELLDKAKNSHEYSIFDENASPVSDESVRIQWNKYLNKTYFFNLKSLLSLSIVERLFVKMNVFGNRIFEEKRILRALNILKCTTHHKTVIDSVNFYLKLKK